MEVKLHALILLALLATAVALAEPTMLLGGEFELPPASLALTLELYDLDAFEKSNHWRSLFDGSFVAADDKERARERVFLRELDNYWLKLWVPPWKSLNRVKEEWRALPRAEKAKKVELKKFSRVIQASIIIETMRYLGYDGKREREAMAILPPRPADRRGFRAEVPGSWLIGNWKWARDLDTLELKTEPFVWEKFHPEAYRLMDLLGLPHSIISAVVKRELNKRLSFHLHASFDDPTWSIAERAKRVREFPDLVRMYNYLTAVRALAKEFGGVVTNLGSYVAFREDIRDRGLVRFIEPLRFEIRFHLQTLEETKNELEELFLKLSFEKSMERMALEIQRNLKVGLKEIDRYQDGSVEDAFSKNLTTFRKVNPTFTLKAAALSARYLPKSQWEVGPDDPLVTGQAVRGLGAHEPPKRAAHLADLMQHGDMSRHPEIQLRFANHFLNGTSLGEVFNSHVALRNFVEDLHVVVSALPPEILDRLPVLRDPNLTKAIGLLFSAQISASNNVAADFMVLAALKAPMIRDEILKIAGERYARDYALERFAAALAAIRDVPEGFYELVQFWGRKFHSLGERAQREVISAFRDYHRDGNPLSLPRELPRVMEVLSIGLASQHDSVKGLAREAIRERGRDPTELVGVGQYLSSVCALPISP